MSEFYEEQLINGVVYWRAIEDGAWQFKIPTAIEKAIEIKPGDKMPLFCHKH